MNVHTPQRGPAESFADYKARRAQSNAMLKSMHRGPHQAPALNKFDVSRFFLGVHTNPAKHPSRRAQHRAAVRLNVLAAGPMAHQIKPKAAKERKRTQHAHPTRDQLGAVTLIGPRVEFEGFKPGTGWFILGGTIGGSTEDSYYTARRIWSPAIAR